MALYLPTRLVPLTFPALEAAAKTNPSVLNKRLKELRETRIMEHGGEVYRLVAERWSPVAALMPLHGWAEG